MATKVSFGFGRLSDTELDNFAEGVVKALTGNAAFPTPPVTLANLQAAKDDLSAKMAAAQTGGPADTAAKNNSRQALITMLGSIPTLRHSGAGNMCFQLPGGHLIRSATLSGGIIFQKR